MPISPPTAPSSRYTTRSVTSLLNGASWSRDGKLLARILDNFTIESRRDMYSRVEIHGRNCAAEKETHVVRLREVTACTARLAKSKHKAASAFQKIRKTRSKSRQKTSDNMSTTAKIHRSNGRIGPMKASTPPMPHPQLQLARRRANNGISKKGRTYPFQPAGRAGTKRHGSVRTHPGCIAADKHNKGFGRNTHEVTSAPAVFMAGPGKPRLQIQPLRSATEEF
ncbi:hypothetical protein BDBG_08851 [Blastomyces gilchristii SLH14081]|uniref:Uncharacterized protein n=1 Tax=Blastomyces gilchristii (strain SLH14081) TaxID=559298 RepID=A0A179V0U4_BLAGS|nr:uncharacterized protein BDBG_08851 [Blastomyces gilchristii SLH14081]OAT13700.1 hypothetical protein BDBG_08851 [Blastomyces gilchristii SLH14081]